MKRLERGFTLIEVLISMFILAFIAFAIYSNTTSSFVLRESLETEGDFYNGVRVALDVIGRDISHLYSPQPAALPGKLSKVGDQTGAAGTPEQQRMIQQQQQQQQGPAGTATNFWSEPLNQQGVRISRLQGESDKLSFISNGHMRLFRDAQESDFVKVSYQLEADKEIQMGRPTTLVLVKTEAIDIFDDVENTSSGTKYILLHDIKSLQFKYLDGEKDTYDNRWDTASQTHWRVFPALIQMTIEVYLPGSTNTLKVTQLYRPELGP